MKTSWKNLWITLVLCLIAACPALAAGSGMAAAEQLDSTERLLYGTIQKGSLTARVDSLETDVFGSVTDKDIMNRIDHLYNYLENKIPVTDGQAHTFILQLNGVDSRINGTQTVGPAKTRLEILEKNLYGKNDPMDPLKSRLAKMVETAYKSETVPVRQATLPMNTVVEVVFPKDVTAKEITAGDLITVRAADNLYVNDVLVLPKGTAGSTVFTKYDGFNWDNFWSGEDILVMTRTVLLASDGREAALNLGEYAKKENKAAAGKVTLNGIVFHNAKTPVKDAKNIVIPAGAKTYMQVTYDVPVNGIVYVAPSK